MAYQGFRPHKPAADIVTEFTPLTPRPSDPAIMSP
jgi:hypothetical protein